MKITHFEVIYLVQRGLLLKVHTDAGLVGYGSPMNYEHGRTVERAIHDMGDYLIGRDPTNITHFMQMAFDDFAGAGTDDAANRRMLGIA